MKNWPRRRWSRPAPPLAPQTQQTGWSEQNFAPLNCIILCLGTRLPSSVAGRARPRLLSHLWRLPGGSLEPQEAPRTLSGGTQEVFTSQAPWRLPEALWRLPGGSQRLSGGSLGAPSSRVLGRWLQYPSASSDLGASVLNGSLCTEWELLY